ncbi:hypothetical protein WMB10_08420 [Tetragenococcus halophilus]|uniref:hypothetical protein n=1 Tax=Tetragenococcus halophilus TaxID=51669 RepID=UPI00083DBFDF|nr:hypothetical protein [Tetragenococcus halophilus]AOF49206.1 hypothetical protein AC806_07315 [Tetragenococcus halophilus]MCT8310086.1 hypothetical protein [Tetragenococcus halophilus]GMQ72963.1 hypothetical protein TEHSL10_05960 [Tetragenococcus halophilus]
MRTIKNYISKNEAYFGVSFILTSVYLIAVDKYHLDFSKWVSDVMSRGITSIFVAVFLLIGFSLLWLYFEPGVSKKVEKNKAFVGLTIYLLIFVIWLFDSLYFAYIASILFLPATFLVLKWLISLIRDLGKSYSELRGFEKASIVTSFTTVFLKSLFKR